MAWTYTKKGFVKTGSSGATRNPADVRAGIDASKLAQTSEAQRTATEEEINKFQQSGAEIKAVQEENPKVQEGIQKYEAAQTQLEKQRIAKQYKLMWDVTYKGKTYRTPIREYLPEEYKRDIKTTPTKSYGFSSAFGIEDNLFIVDQARKQTMGGQFKGEVRAAPMGEMGISELFAPNLIKKSKELSYHSQFLENEPTKKVLYATASFGVSATGTFLYSLRHPVKTVKGVAEFVYTGATAPISEKSRLKMVDMVYSAQAEPDVAAGQIVGTAGALKTFGIGLKAQPIKFEYAKFDVPTKAGSETLYRGFGLTFRGRSQPLIGAKGWKPSVGTPKVDLAKADFSKGLVFEKATQTAILRKNLPKIYESAELKKFDLGLDIMRATETTKSKFILKQFVKETGTLQPKGVKEVLKTTKKYGGEVYGSFAARSQMPKDLARLSADIDIQFKFDTAKTEMIAGELVKNLRKVGEPVRQSPKRPSLIEIKGQKGGKEWRHAVDIHSLQDALKDVSSPAIAGEKIYGLRLGQKAIKIEDIKTMPLSEQGLRKGASTFTLRESKFFPEAHRIKDIGDFFNVQEALIRSKSFGKSKLSSKLTQLKELYPKELSSSRPTKTKIYSSKSRSKSVSTTKYSPFIVSFSKTGSISKSKSRSASKSPFSISSSLGFSPSPSRSPSPSPSPSRSPFSISSSSSLSKSISRSYYSRSISRSGSPYSVSYSYSSSSSYSKTTTTSPFSFDLNKRIKKKKDKKKTRKSKAVYKPSLFGMELYRVRGQYIKSAPKVTAGAGIRLPVGKTKIIF